MDIRRGPRHFSEQSECFTLPLPLDDLRSVDRGRRALSKQRPALPRCVPVIPTDNLRYFPLSAMTRARRIQHFTRVVPVRRFSVITVGNASIMAAYGLTFEDIDDVADNQDESND